MIRIRRVKPGVFRRRRYEVVLVEDGQRTVRRTSTPVTVLDGALGVGDVWSLVHAADEAWENGDQRWISLDARPDSSPRSP